MSVRENPILGGWYRDVDDDGTFQVVLFDETDGVVEIQYSNGDVRALELEEWLEMDVESVTEPSEWASPDDEDADAPRRERLSGGEDDWPSDLS